MEEKRQRGRPKQAVVAVDRETGQKIVFESALHASEVLGVDVGNISRVCKGIRRYAGKYIFYYI